MKKLKLAIEDLEVESFAIRSGKVRGGTVHAHMSEEGTCTTCWGDSRDCTANPANAECYVSDQYCSEAEPCWYTNPEYGNYGC